MFIQKRIRGRICQEDREAARRLVSELKLLSKTTKLIQAVFYLFIMYSISLSIRLLLMVGWEVLMGIPKPSSQDNLWWNQGWLMLWRVWTSHQDVPSRGVWVGEETSFLFCLHSSRPHSHWSHTEHCVPGMTMCKHVLCRVPVHSISLVGRTVWGTEHGFGGDRAGFYQGQKKSRVSKGPYDTDGPLNLSSIKREVQFFPPRLVPRLP